jgi:hypothetical protein
MQRDSALDLQRSMQVRMNNLPVDAGQLRERLTVERDKHSEKHRALSLIVNRCNQLSGQADSANTIIVKDDRPLPHLVLEIDGQCSTDDGIANRSSEAKHDDHGRQRGAVMRYRSAARDTAAIRRSAPPQLGQMAKSAANEQSPVV